MHKKFQKCIYKTQIGRRNFKYAFYNTEICMKNFKISTLQSRAKFHDLAHLPSHMQDSDTIIVKYKILYVSCIEGFVVLYFPQLQQ